MERFLIHRSDTLCAKWINVQQIGQTMGSGSRHQSIPYPTSSDSSPRAAPLVGINYSSRWWWMYRNRAWTLSIEHRFQCLLRPRGRIPGQRCFDAIQISLYFAPLSSSLCLLLRVDQKLIEWFYFWLEYLPSLTRPRRVLIPGAAPTADGRDY